MMSPGAGYQRQIIFADKLELEEYPGYAIISCGIIAARGYYPLIIERVRFSPFGRTHMRTLYHIRFASMV